MIAYVELGILFREIKADKFIEAMKPGIKIFLISTLIVSGTICSVINGFAQVLRCNYGTYPVLFIMSSMLLGTAVVIISVWIRKNQLLELIGKWTMCILVMHKFPILLFQQVVPVTKSLLAENAAETPSSILCGIIVSGVVVVLCMVVGWIIKKICPVIIGQKQ